MNEHLHRSQTLFLQSIPSVVQTKENHSGLYW